MVEELATSHRLGLVSNLWSHKGPWISELDRAGVASAFEWMVFSSDGPYTKPSARIFDSILQACPDDKSRILMIGDSLKRDVGGAKAVGIKSLWIAEEGKPHDTALVPDFRLPDLLELPGSGVLA